MTEIQLFTVLATGLGIVTTVLNLVAFVREKDRGHTRAALWTLFFLALIGGVVLFPRYAPDTSKRLLASAPASSRPVLELWLGSTPAADPVPEARPTATPLQGSFTVEIRRNLFGGISSVVAHFQFASLGNDAVRVNSYRIRIPDAKGGAPRSFERVLPHAINVAPGATQKSDVDFDPEIRDCWVPWHALDAAHRQAVEMHWDGQTADGQRFSVASSNG